jgi:hypothetical protein
LVGAKKAHSVAFDPSQGEFAARRLLADPAAAAADLGVIAGAFPGLLTRVAVHPNLSPVLESQCRAFVAPLGRSIPWS